MKKTLALLLSAFCLTAVLSAPAMALEYSFDGADAGQFAEPTSEETLSVGTRETVNIDRSKTAAIIPPSFGSPTSYTLNSGEYLTPNLVNQGNNVVKVTANGSTGVTVLPSTEIAGTGDSVVPPIMATTSYTAYTATSYTDVTSDLYFSGGELGTLSIPTINLTVKVYQGTDNTTLAKGAGHFTDTSAWDGNIAIAAHNRGVTNHFGQIHTLNVGDRVIYTTKLGTRTYEVSSVSKINVDDGNVLAASSGNKITLVTCVMNQPEYRWCVVANEVA